MTEPKSLFQMAGADPKPPSLSEAALVVIDAQNEYVTGALPLSGVNEAAAQLSALIGRARSAGTTIVHIAHKGKPGGLFDRDADNGQIIAAAAPDEGEVVIEKPLPNAFAGTDLDAVLKTAGSKPLIIAGFMTHLCVSSTARAALDLGYTTTIAADACATRDLPNPLGGLVSAQTIHDSSLTALGDRFACIVRIRTIPN
ncbi:MAG: cysteine hydrolase family protein [Pseudomonadota bacterium]